MNVANKVVVVTGAARGIGEALVVKFHEQGARVVLIDRDLEACRKVAAGIDGHAYPCDVTDEQALTSIIDEVEANIGPIELMCSNAGIATGDGAPWWATSGSNQNWQLQWEVNVMAHVYAARACLPYFLKRNRGYFLNTASAAGLLSLIGDAAYSATKHAAISFAESLAIAHCDQGIKVSVLAPQGVATRMTDLEHSEEAFEGILSPEQVADTVVNGLAEECFLILPHPEVTEFVALKTKDYDRWLSGMGMLRRQALAEAKSSDRHLPMAVLNPSRR